MPSIDPAWDVVFIDDEVDSVGVIVYIFQCHDIKLRFADNGETGLSLLRERKPTFLLLDIQMLKMSGYDVLKIIREDSALKDLPVIAVTAHALEIDRKRALAAGFDGYITKPITVTTFLDELT